MKNSQYSANKIRQLVSSAWAVLYRACERSSELSGWLREAEDTALRQEKQHRGARFTGGQAGYRVPASTAARCIIIHHVWAGYGGNGRDCPPQSWGTAASIRHDCALAYALRERMTLETLDKIEPCARIDYAEDIAA